jgi:DNA polymerase zeta
MFLDSDYYITKNIIPPLDRIFNLIGVSVRSWYDEMPKIVRIPHQLQDSDSVSKRSLIHSYMKSSLCIVCQVNDASNSLICAYCKADVAKSYYILQSRGINLQRNLCNLLDVCRSCARISRAEDVACVSQDCPVYFSRVRAMSKVRYSGRISEVFEKQVLSRDDSAW